MLLFSKISKGIEDSIRTKYRVVQYELDERGRRMWAAVETTSLGHGGVAAVARATGIAESTIRIGRREMNNAPNYKNEAARRIRKKGGGRKSVIENDYDLLVSLDALVVPTARGDPTSPLRWTCKSTRRLAKELTAKGHVVSHTKVAQLLGS